MKAGIIYIAIFAFALFIIPIASIGFRNMPGYGSAREPEAKVHSPAAYAPESSAPDHVSQASAPPYSEAPPASSPENGTRAEEDAHIQLAAAVSHNGVNSFTVLDESTGSVSEISLRDFVRGAVAAEMPVSFHKEALKAQAVAAHTFALHNHYVQQASPDPDLKGADFSADPSHMKVYITEATARKFYGDEYADVYWDKICEAADSVLLYILEYDGEPIVAAYHAISAGQTEDASNVWSGKADYLKAIASEGDYLAPDYEAAVDFTLEDVRGILLSSYPNADLSGEPGSWFSSIERSDSGYITEIDVGGIKLHGKDIRTLFNLRSHNMDIFYSDSGFRFVTCGYGHGVGLSQYGADFLARQGYTFDQILEKYYTGVVLKQIDMSPSNP